MCGQLLLAKSWCGEKGNSHDVYAVLVMKDNVVVGHLPRKNIAYRFTIPYERWNESVGESWEKDASVDHWRACVSKCLEYFRSFKFEWSLNFRVYKF